MHLCRPPKVLILESQMIVAADVSLQLSKLGYDVIGINTRPEDALKTIQNDRPDIVLMNIERKGKRDGIRVAKVISKTFWIPVVFLSAHTDREIFHQAIHAEPYAFITKPFGAKDLQRGLETALDRMDAEGLWGKKHLALSPDTCLFVLQNNYFIKPGQNDISFAKANRNYCQLSAPDEAFQPSVPLRKIEDRAPGRSFLRVHRSSPVHLNKLTTQHGKHLFTQNYQIPISRRLRREVIKYIRGAQQHIARFF